MAHEPHGTVLKHIRTLFNVGVTADLTDGQLLERFVTRRGEPSESAFATLVERHGSMVLRACRGIVGNDHDAEDAFQATFLLLVRRSKTLWVRDSLGPWLHRVASRVAIRAKLAKDRRRVAEKKAFEAARHSYGNGAQENLVGILHEEIDRLPDRYRMPIVLCDLEYRRYEDIARYLRCPIGTVKSRLARGRERLRDRLTRRGLAPALGPLGAGFSADSARAAIPVALVDYTTRAALRLVTSKGTDAPVTASVASLLKGASRTMAMYQLGKIAGAGIVLGIVAIVGVTLVAMGSQPQAIATAITGKSSTDDPKDDFDKIQGKWIRISTDGNEHFDPKTVTMVVKKSTDQHKGDVPAGAAEFVFAWNTEGREDQHPERVLLDPTKEPKTLDFYAPEHQQAGPRVCHGIYKLEGQTLTICFEPIGGARPSEFVSEPGRGHIVDVYRRAKP